MNLFEVYKASSHVSVTSELWYWLERWNVWIRWNKPYDDKKVWLSTLAWICIPTQTDYTLKEEGGKGL